MKRTVLLHLFIISFLLVLSVGRTSLLSADDDEYSDKKYVYSPKGLFLRKGPGLKHEKMILLPHMAVLELQSVEEAVEIIGGIAGSWCEVTTADGKTGWAFSGFLSNTRGDLKYEQVFRDALFAGMKKEAARFVSAPVTKVTRKNIVKAHYGGVAFDVILTAFTDTEYREKNGYEDSYWIIDYKNEKREFESMKEGAVGKRGHTSFWGGGKFRVIRINDRKYEYIPHFFQPSMDFYIEYVTFSGNLKLNAIASLHVTYLDNRMKNDLFVRRPESEELLYTLKGRDLVKHFETFIEAVAGEAFRREE